MRAVLTGLAGALVVIGAISGSGSAATPTPSTTAEPPAATSRSAPAPAAADVVGEGVGTIGTSWQTERVALAWDGEPYTTAERSFVGVPVTVPGDLAGRTLRVSNDGPTTGTLRAWVQEVDLRDPAATGGTEDGFYDDLQLAWSTQSQRDAASFRALAASGRTQIAEIDLAPGEGTDISVAYRLPRDATTGNRADVGGREASFVVHLEIAGDLPGQAAVRQEPLATTGAELLHAALLGAGAVVVGRLLVAAARRRRGGDARPGAPGSV